jgi:phenylacetate-CoA ligase
MVFPPMHPAFVRHVLYPVYRGLRNDRILDNLAELERVQWLGRGEIEDLQWQRLQRLLSEAAARVPYYHDLFDGIGLQARDVQNPDDFRRIPFLTKEAIRAAGSGLVTRDPFRKGFSSSTGGSTGEPLYFHVDRAADPMRRANGLRVYRWAGIDVGDRQAFLWGVHLERSLRERLATAVRNYFNNIIYLSTFEMSERSMAAYAAQLGRYRPKALIGYPSTLTLFADFVRRRGLNLPAPKAVFTSGEHLIPEQRAAIEEAFGSSVFNRYGNREFAGIAQECEAHEGLHLMSDLLYVEVIHESGRPARSGEAGEIVVTDLYNFYMPFVRYRTGDVAVASERACPCGRGLPLLERVEGRIFDEIVTPGGARVGGFFWTWLSRAVPGIERFQIEQRDRGGVIFRIVPGPDWRDDFKARLAEKIRENCGENFKVQFMLVEEIALTPSGKSRFIVSRIEEREVIKSKIHKARVTGSDPESMDCLAVDAGLMELADIAEFEKVLVVDNTNGARVETVAVPGGRGGGGAVSKLVRPGDEISVMAFTWSSGGDAFRNLLVDSDNRFVRFMEDTAGETT